MKILQVSHTFLPKYVAGTEIYTYEIAKALQKKGNDVRVAYTDPLSTQYSLNKIKFENITCYEMQKDAKLVFDFENSYKDKQIEDFFQEILNDFNPDVIHYQHLMFLSTNITSMVKKMKIRQIITLHDFWFQCLTHKRITTDNELCVNPTLEKCLKCHKDLLKRTQGIPPLRLWNLYAFLYFLFQKNAIPEIKTKIDNRIKNEINYYFKKGLFMNQLNNRLTAHKNALTDVDNVIYPTKFLQTELYKWGLKGKKDLISNDGIQDEYFKNFKKTKSKKIRFGFIGSIVPAKGLLVLTEAWDKIETKKAILKVFGNLSDDPDYSKKIKNIIKKHKNIELKGRFKPNQIKKVFEEIDVLVVPSTWYENAPLVLRDALLTRTPAIATNLGGLTEIINERNSGLLFENNDNADLAFKISKVIENPELLNNFHFPEQKNINQNAEELIKLYKTKK